MKKKEKKEKVHTISIRDMLAKQLETVYDTVLVESFGDKSASWIEVKERVDSRIISYIFSFDYKGNTIDGVQTFVTEVREVEDMPVNVTKL
jgi:hypothetical protein